MSTVLELENKRQQLENEVRQLVDELESRKGPGQLRVPKEFILKSKEEQDTEAAFEKLTIDEESDALTEPCQQQSEPKKTPKQVYVEEKKKANAKNTVVKPTDVSRLDLRIGRILEVSRHPNADSLYVVKIDCGDTRGGPRTVISGLVGHVPMEEMMNRNVVVLCNLKPIRMRGILSRAMVMCASSPDKVEMLGTPEGVKPGDRIVFDKYPGEPDEELNPKKKIWEKVAPDIKTNDDGVAMYKDCEFKVSGCDGQFKSNLKNVNVR